LSELHFGSKTEKLEPKTTGWPSLMPSTGHKTSGGFFLLKMTIVHDLMNEPPEQHQRPLLELHLCSKRKTLADKLDPAELAATSKRSMVDSDARS
jgi:hypothetical protein